MITHSTYLGGSDNDQAQDIVYDYSQNVAYISGQTWGPHFPIPVTNPANTYDQSFGGDIDNFICALKDNSTSILWATYLGGSDTEDYDNLSNGSFHQSICIDGNHNLFLGGASRTSETQTNPFPLDNNGGLPTYYQSSLDGPIDATITKFDLVPVTVVGIKEITFSTDDILIYPNPATQNLHIKLKSKVDKVNYNIVNALGQVVSSGTLNSDINMININKLSTGFYMIELLKDNSKISAKFIKND
ncbi:MAG: T9SS type A sorting domain-containing protein [Bacteroidota bacterium]